jgi:hypothetical protein
MCSRRFAAGLSLCALLAFAAVSVEKVRAQSGSALRFAWAVALRDASGGLQAIDYDADVLALASGDRLRIFLKPLDDCYAYLYLHDSQGDLQILFPREAAARPAALVVAGTYALPDIDSWYRLDEHPGIEVFYLIVGHDRLPELETRTLALARRDAAAKERLLDEIHKLIKESSPVGAAVNRPATMAGSLRGVQEQREVEARIVEVQRVYVATIRLRH